jgi:hypothetical protein
MDERKYNEIKLMNYLTFGVVTLGTIIGAAYYVGSSMKQMSDKISALEAALNPSDEKGMRKELQDFTVR